MEKEKRKAVPSSRRTTLIYVLVFMVIVFAIIVVLALMGPTQGNIFSNISLGLRRD